MARAFMRRMPALLSVCAVGLLVGCTGAPSAATGTPVPVPPPAATGTPSAPPASATTPQATPTAVPVPTFTTVWEPAIEAPAGAVTIELRIVNYYPRFEPAEITVPAGDVALFLNNVRSGGADHDFRLGPELLVQQAASPRLRAADSGILTIFDLPAGTYQIWCAVHQHYRDGMTGTVTVTP